MLAGGVGEMVDLTVKRYVTSGDARRDVRGKFRLINVKLKRIQVMSEEEVETSTPQPTSFYSPSWLDAQTTHGRSSSSPSHHPSAPRSFKVAAEGGNVSKLEQARAASIASIPRLPLPQRVSEVSTKSPPQRVSEVLVKSSPPAIDQAAASGRSDASRARPIKLAAPQPQAASPPAPNGKHDERRYGDRQEEVGGDRAEVDRLREEVKGLSAERTALLSSIDKLKREASERRGEMEKQQASMQAMQADLRAYEREKEFVLTQTQAAQGEMREAMAAVEELGKGLGTMSAQAERGADAQLERMLQLLDSAERAQERLDETVRAVGKLAQGVEKTRGASERDPPAGAVLELERRLAELRLQLEQVTAEKECATGNVESMSLVLQQTRGQLTESEASMARMQAELAAARESLEATREELQAAREEVERLRTRAEVSLRTGGELIRSLHDAELERNLLQDKTRQQDAWIQHMSVRIRGTYALVGGGAGAGAGAGGEGEGEGATADVSEVLAFAAVVCLSV
eukprot:764142-Hanusia_phi.AAC.4